MDLKSSTDQKKNEATILDIKTATVLDIKIDKTLDNTSFTKIDLPESPELVINPPVIAITETDSSLVAPINEEIKIEEVKDITVHDDAVVEKDNIANKKDVVNTELSKDVVETLNQKKKRLWKTLNPGEKIKHYEKLHKLGLIDKLPWEDIIIPIDNVKKGTYIMIDKQSHQKKRVKYNKDE